ncbi:hypothetical protein yc1106_02981 [Curvularia clavata]|uniref:Uncharacterized protein n=1 Tax=Curvularia clavata TaxID=95742 RepID=A0A9Q8Z4T5_CURCL|nr:hypothetical protein yc1106_02981 [Curvularia clavata]
MWLEEMTLLEQGINANAKGRIFDLEKKTDGEYSDIRSKKKMEDLIKGTSQEKKYKNLDAASQARVAVLNLRQTIGAFKYMQDEKVAKIFADQKNRMGAIIGYIDKELHKTPRIYYPPGRDAYSARPCVDQGLEQRWDKYMDGVFELAKKGATDYKELHLDNLNAAWNSQSKKDEYKENDKDDKATKERKEVLKQSHKEILGLIDKCQKEWNKVKDWKKLEHWSEDNKTDDGSENEESNKQPADGDKTSQPENKGTNNR